MHLFRNEYPALYDPLICRKVMYTLGHNHRILKKYVVQFSDQYWPTGWDASLAAVINRRAAYRNLRLDHITIEREIKHAFVKI